MDITEILLNVALNTIILTLNIHVCQYQWRSPYSMVERVS